MWSGLQSEWQQQQLAALGLLIIGVGLLAYTMLEHHHWYGLTGSLAASGAIYWLLRLSQRKPVSELYHVFKEHPEQIRWVYAVITERHPFGFKFSSSAIIYLVEEDGYEYSVSIPRTKAKLVSKTLNRVLPHAEFGYTEERDLKYRGEITGQKRFSWWSFDEDTKQ